MNFDAAISLINRLHTATPKAIAFIDHLVKSGKALDLPAPFDKLVHGAEELETVLELFQILTDWEIPAPLIPTKP